MEYGKCLIMKSNDLGLVIIRNFGSQMVNDCSSYHAPQVSLRMTHRFRDKGSCDGRVVKALDSKSNGVSPRRFEPCSQRSVCPVHL